MREEAKQTGLEGLVAGRGHQLIVRVETRLADQLKIVDQRAVLDARRLVQNRGNQLYAHLDRQFHDETHLDSRFPRETVQKL